MKFKKRELKTLQSRIERFIELGKEKHGHARYDYSIAKKEYKNNRTKVHLICTQCNGEPFLVYPFRHTSKGDNEQGCCSQCYVLKRTVQETRWNPNLPERTQKFLTRINKKYNDSLDFPYVAEEYKNESSRITVICKKCSSAPFKRLARSLKAKDRKGGCESCNKEENQQITNQTISQRQLRNHSTKDIPRKYGCIYKITNTKNNKTYIGYTNMTAKKRFKAHIDETRRMQKGHKEKSSYLHNAMNYHGFEHFTVEILEEFTNVTPIFLGKLEMKYIEEENPDYNLSPGGELA